MQRYIFILLIFLGFQSFGQLSSTIVLEADSVNVGELVRAKLKITMPANEKFRALDIQSVFEPITLGSAIVKPDSMGNYDLPDFEIDKLGNWNNFRDSKQVPYAAIEWTDDPSLNKSYSENEISFRFWDPGVFKIKAGDFILQDSSQSVVPLEATLLFVRVPEMNIDTTQKVPIKPIKSIFREPSSWKDYLPLLLGFLLACLLIYLLIKFSKKKTEVVEEEIVEPYREPHVIALEKLYTLAEKGLWQKGEIKTYQSNLTDIIREYLDKRYNVPAQELTTDEITQALKKKNFNAIYESQLREILTMADLIKFAKAKPPADIHDQFMNTAINFVQNTQTRISEEEE